MYHYHASLNIGFHKATIVWSRVVDHVASSLLPSPSLKDLIRFLRSQQVPQNDLRAAASVLLDEQGEITTLNHILLIRFLVLLSDPKTPRQKPRSFSLLLSIVYLCNIPSIPADSEFCDSAQHALQRIREEINALKARNPQPLRSPGQNPSDAPRRDFYENVNSLFESLLRKGDLREIDRFPQYLSTLSTIRSKMASRAPVEEVRSLQVRKPRG